MRYLVELEPTTEAANKLDSGPGGPGPLFGYIAERWKPEAFYLRADRRIALWVIDFPDVASLVELTHVALARAGVAPKVVPLLTGAEGGEILPRAIQRAQLAP